MIRCDYCSQPATNRVFDDSKKLHIHYVCPMCKPKYENEKTHKTEFIQKTKK